MKAAVIALFLVASCGGGGETPPDAPRAELPPSDQHCASTCGDGQLDRCWKTMNSSATVYWQMETCDGMAMGTLPTCESIGLCGTIGCPTSGCIGIDTSKCLPCN